MKRLISLFICLCAFVSYVNAAETVIIVDGKPLEFFDANKTEYRYYLPHGTTKIPKVTASNNAKISVRGEQKIVTVSLDDKTYKIVFETLPKLDMFLCIGQSNMAGRAPINDEDKTPIPNVYLFTPQGNWEPAVNPLNKYSSVRKEIGVQKIGPAYGFAKKIAETTGRPVGLIVNAKGGTTIEEWTKGNKADLYGKSIQRALDAKRWGEYKSILWHQGESSIGRVKTYPEQLKELVKNLRTDLGDDKLFFVAGEIGRWQKDNGFNAMLGKIKTFVDNSGIVSAKDLKPINGNINDPHFDRESQLILGTRYAECVLKNVLGR
ncbi:MAG: sialate O-acetylesterase [Planctomycetaceae bacterium]|jgi:hypothetical protein|nr:sialate O-acetylesterase [Planctomycetaceae bacterium]